MNTNRLHQTFTLESPPEITSKKATVFVNNTSFLIIQGEILSRYSNLGFRHLAMFYGGDKNGVYWFLENNQDGIRFVTFEDFLGNNKGLRKESKYPIVSIKLALSRAKKRAGLAYRARFNNCELFISYITTGLLKSEQSEAVEDVVECVARMCIQVYFGSQENESSKIVKYLLENNLKQIGLNRFPDLRSL